MLCYYNPASTPVLVSSHLSARPVTSHSLQSTSFIIVLFCATKELQGCISSITVLLFVSLYIQVHHSSSDHPRHAARRQAEGSDGLWLKMAALSISLDPGLVLQQAGGLPTKIRISSEMLLLRLLELILRIQYQIATPRTVQYIQNNRSIAAKGREKLQQGNPAAFFACARTKSLLQYHSSFSGRCKP